MPPHPHCHWRGVKEWRDLGIPMSTTSDEACKMFDAAFTQVVNHFNDEAIGGTMGCIEKALAADPDFIMGHVMKLCMSGKKIKNDPTYAQEVYKLVELSQKPDVPQWERQHVNAVKLFSEGYVDKASVVWEDITVEYPYDFYAARFAYEMYIVNGNSAGLRDCCGRILPRWKESTPLYGDLLSMYAFGLEETNIYTKGEKLAMQALDINPYDAWANHTVAHCKEMTGQLQHGVQFMQDTEKYWNDSNLLCHNYWHWALLLVEKGEFEAAIGILDNHILPFLKKYKTAFSHSDAASLCFRLESEGFNMMNQWQQCYNEAKNQCGDFSWAFFDLHSIMSLTHADKRPEADRLIEGIKQFISEDKGDSKTTYKNVVMPISEAFIAWDDKDYDKAVEIMKPLRYKIFPVGGSNAQRDIFTLFTIHAGLRSAKQENKLYAKHLLLERQCIRGETPMTSRLLQKTPDEP